MSADKVSRCECVIEEPLTKSNRGQPWALRWARLAELLRALVQGLKRRPFLVDELFASIDPQFRDSGGHPQLAPPLASAPEHNLCPTRRGIHAALSFQTLGALNQGFRSWPLGLSVN